MNWSYSGYRQFNKCNRQWYYSNIVAHPNATKDSHRKEVTILSRLKTLDAWRGDIVDQLISKVIINHIKKNKGLDVERLLWVADRMFEDQYEFATKKKYREPGITISEHDSYAAILDLDNDRPISQDELERVRDDVHTSIRNFMAQSDLIDYLRSASHWITQRDLQYPFSKFKTKGRPDLIVFFDDDAPHIFDWKVHTFATKTYQDQLISYALALYKVSKTKPHRDFPKNISTFALTEYKLTEFQLLINQIREYSVTEEDILEAENTISSGLLTMYRVGANRKYNECIPDDFPTTRDPSNCEKCSFKPICKS